MVMGTAQEKAMQVQYLTIIWVDEQKVWTRVVTEVVFSIYA
jgi:hypothetical protein